MRETRARQCGVCDETFVAVATLHICGSKVGNDTRPVPMAEEATGLIEINLEIMLVAAAAVTPVTPAAAAVTTVEETALSIMLWAVVVRLPAIIETSTSSLMVGGGNLPS